MTTPSLRRFTAPLLAGLMLLGACATATPYQPANSSGFGYGETQIEADRWQLTFSGNSSTDRATVERYMLFRAAEITDQAGYDFFRIVNRDVQSESRFVSTSDAFGGGFGYYRRGFGGFTTVETRERQSFQAIAEIVVFRGTPDDDDTSAFVADDMLVQLAGTVQRPQ